MTTETPTPLFEDAAKYVPVDVALLRRIVDASDNAPTPSASSPRCVAYLNNGFTGDYVGWGGCGHWFQWRDCLATFSDDANHGGDWCPACLVDEIGRGEVVVDNIDRVRVWIGPCRFCGRRDLYEPLSDEGTCVCCLLAQDWQGHRPLPSFPSDRLDWMTGAAIVPSHLMGKYDPALNTCYPDCPRCAEIADRATFMSSPEAT
jgi:hypothetical protein